MEANNEDAGSATTATSALLQHVTLALLALCGLVLCRCLAPSPRSSLAPLGNPAALWIKRRAWPPGGASRKHARKKPHGKKRDGPLPGAVRRLPPSPPPMPL